MIPIYRTARHLLGRWRWSSDDGHTAGHTLTRRGAIRAWQTHERNRR